MCLSKNERLQLNEPLSHSPHILMQSLRIMYTHSSQSLIPLNALPETWTNLMLDLDEAILDFGWTESNQGHAIWSFRHWLQPPKLLWMRQPAREASHGFIGSPFAAVKDHVWRCWPWGRGMWDWGERGCGRCGGVCAAGLESGYVSTGPLIRLSCWFNLHGK